MLHNEAISGKTKRRTVPKPFIFTNPTASKNKQDGSSALLGLAKSIHLTLVSANHASCNPGQGPGSRKSQKLFGSEKPFVKLPTACSGKPIV